MIKMVVGLGNPGSQYEKTRHNAGFLFLDQFLKGASGTWQVEPKFDGVTASYSIGVRKLLLLKPATFMNRSGLSVGKVARYYKIEPEEILVVHDELDFDVGVVKLKYDGGHAGHNGIRDIVAHLGSNRFYRLRIGIGRSAVKGSVADYVLSPFSKIELDLIYAVCERVNNQFANIVDGNIELVKNELN